MTTKKNDRPFVEAILEGTEAAVDLITNNEAIKAVPVIGTAIKLLKGVDDLRSRMLAAKLSRFLGEPSLRHSLEARRVRKDILQDAEQDEEIGEMLFMVIDKVTDMSKPVLLAKVFAAYLDELFERDLFLVLVHAIDLSAAGDLQELIRTGREKAYPANRMRSLRHERLASAGLYRSDINYEFPHNLEYRLSPAGGALLAAIEHCERIG